MSFSETPGSNTGDQPKPKSANPPVPLQEMQKQGKKIASMEAAHTAALQDEQSNAAATLDAELAGLDAREVAKKREKELCQWIECTPEMANFRPVETVAKACQEAESECREILDPEYDITQDIDEAVSVASEAVLEVSDEAKGGKNENNIAEKTERNADTENVAKDPEPQALKTVRDTTKKHRTETKENESETIDIQSKYQELRQNHSQIETLQLLLQDQALSENHRERLQNILNTISQLQSVVPQAEQAAFSQILESSNLHLGSASMAAVFVEVWHSAEASNDLSEETKEKIREKLRIPSSRPRNGDELLKQIGDREKAADAEDGAVPFDEDHPIKLDENIDVYPDGGGYLVEADTGSFTLRIRFPKHMTPHHLTDEVNNAMVCYGFSSAGFTDIPAMAFGEGHIEIRGGVMEVNKPGDRAVGEKLAGAMLGEWNGYAKGEFLTPADLTLMRWRLQALYKTGDAGMGDDNPSLARESLTELGIIKNGKIDFDALEKAGSFIRMSDTLPTFENVLAQMREEVSGGANRD